MSNIDDMSRALGGLEKSVEAILTEQVRQGKKIDSIDTKVNKEKVRSAYIAGGAAGVLMGIKELLAKIAAWNDSGG